MNLPHSYLVPSVCRCLCCSPKGIDQLQLLPGSVTGQEEAGFSNAGTASALYPPLSIVWGPHPELAGVKALFVGLRLHYLAVKQP